MTLTIPLTKHSFSSFKEYNILSTAGQPEWLMHACVHFKLSPLVYKIGSIAVSAIAFSPSRGLFTPSVKILKDAIARIGYNTDDEESLAHYESRINKDRAEFIIDLGATGALRLKKPAAEKLLTSANILLVNTHVTPPSSPSPALRNHSMQALRDLQYCLKYPKRALSLHQKEIFIGSCKDVINAAAIEKVALFFNKNLRAIFHWAIGASETHIQKIDADISVMLHKRNDLCMIYAIFLKNVTRGGYKRVHLAAKITNVIEPFGVTFCEDRKDFEIELSFRQNPRFKPLLTDFEAYERIGREFVVAHTWANCGSLYEILKNPQDVFYKHQFAKQLLEKLHTFHTNGALHLDLHSQNLLVNYDGGFKVDLYINDVGSSILKSKPLAARRVATQSSYLAPEILHKLAPSHGYYWDEVLDFDLTIEERELSERFQIGLILYEIYFGKPLYKNFVTDAEIKTTFPLYLMSSAKAFSSPLIFSLDKYVEDVDFEDIESHFRDAFDRYYKTLTYHEGMPFYPATGEEAPVEGLDPSFSKQEQLAARYDAIFDEHFKDIEKRFLMIKHLDADGLENFIRIYKLARRDHESDISRFRYEKYARSIAGITKPISELIPGILDDHDEIMKVFMPLLSLNPQERPTLDVVLAALNAKLS